uniref:Uncharacterized protein n=1 Tax=Oryza sativa subsp. japonica TaxID=39947 RepID=Q2QW72_ORYSJ|nr:hypothetical protein LOC_Os12g10350 [Oryza sativa Japonica Group]
MEASRVGGVCAEGGEERQEAGRRVKRKQRNGGSAHGRSSGARDEVGMLRGIQPNWRVGGEAEVVRAETGKVYHDVRGGNVVVVAIVG